MAATTRLRVAIGNTNALGGTLIQGGADGVTLTAGVADNINIGTENDNIITLGNASGTEPLKLQGTGITQTLTGSSTNPSDVIQTTTNSTSAFQVQEASGTSLFNVDTANSQITAGTSSTTTFGNTFNVSTAPLGGYTSGYYWDGGSGKQAWSLSSSLPPAAGPSLLCLPTSGPMAFPAPTTSTRWPSTPMTDRQRAGRLHRIHCRRHAQRLSGLEHPADHRHARTPHRVLAGVLDQRN